MSVGVATVQSTSSSASSTKPQPVRGKRGFTRNTRYDTQTLQHSHNAHEVKVQRHNALRLRYASQQRSYTAPMSSDACEPAVRETEAMLPAGEAQRGREQEKREQQRLREGAVESGGWVEAPRHVKHDLE